MAASRPLRDQLLGQRDSKASGSPELRPVMKSAMSAKDVTLSSPMSVPAINQPESCAASCSEQHPAAPKMGDGGATFAHGSY